MALEPVDMRLGAEWLGALVREIDPGRAAVAGPVRVRGKRGHTMKVLTWDGDQFVYFDEVLRVLPYWPQDGYLELAPQHLSRGGLGDRVGGGQTDRSYPQVAVAALGSIAVASWGRPN